MLDKASATTKPAAINYPIHDSTLPFTDYITQCRRIIIDRRLDLGIHDKILAQRIIETNSPFELKPKEQQRTKYGALLIHGLLDCPLSLRDLGKELQSAGILCRSILLPGHGTQPEDLISVSYHDWIQTLRYGVENLKRDVDELFLVGYSTGAALSIYQALMSNHISGIILLAPAIRLRAPIDLAVSWYYLKKWFGFDHNPWLFKMKEDDYAKYLSIPIRPVAQVSQLTRLIHELRLTRTLHCPLFLAVSHDDETVSSKHALQFFAHHTHAYSKLLLYTAHHPTFDDPRIIVRSSHFPKLHVNHFSHICMPFAPDNYHYGQTGDYPLASRYTADHDLIYGAYNKAESYAYEFARRSGFVKSKYQALTYNPDFEYMSHLICDFIFGL